MIILPVELIKKVLDRLADSRVISRKIKTLEREGRNV
jgi:hypothetical protein